MQKQLASQGGCTYVQTVERAFEHTGDCKQVDAYVLRERVFLVCSVHVGMAGDPLANFRRAVGTDPRCVLRCLFLERSRCLWRKV